MMYLAKYYGHLERNLHEFVMTFVTRPSYFFYSLFRSPKLEYIAMLLSPLAAIDAVRPVKAIRDDAATCELDPPPKNSVRTVTSTSIHHHRAALRMTKHAVP